MIVRSMTRADEEVGEGVYDSIRWLFETHIKEEDTGEYNFAIVYGNEDAPTTVELYRSADPIYDQQPDRIWGER